MFEMLDFIRDHDLFGYVTWVTDKNNRTVTFYLNCNDLFYWACADCEEIGLDDLPALAECLRIDSIYGNDLFCCRKRGMRPQKAFYSLRGVQETPDLIKLFNECGPERCE